MEKQKSPRVNSWNGWDPLEEAWVGRTRSADYFDSIKSDKIKDPLKRIADETEEDYQKLIAIIKDFGVTVHRPEYDNRARWGDGSKRPAVQPRDHHFAYGNTLYKFENHIGYDRLYNELQDSKENIYDPYKDQENPVTHEIECASVVRFGDAVLIDRLPIPHMKWFKETFKDTKIFVSTFGGHSDGCFAPVKPGLIVTTYDYKHNFKDSIFDGWDFIYTEDDSFEQMAPVVNVGVLEMLKKTENKWYVSGEENNDEFIGFVNQYLEKWVGYCAESVFDVNMFMLDERHAIVNSHNDKIFEGFKKHKVEPIICNLRHRYFWDGGLHCNTVDIRRRGTRQRYLNY